MEKDAEDYRKQVIATCEARKEFEVDIDGFTKWWPANRGFLTASDLRTIADELDARNAEWQRTIDEEFTDERR